MNEYDAVMQVVWYSNLTSKVAMRPSFAIVANCVLECNKLVECCKKRKSSPATMEVVYQVMTEMLPIPLSACGVMSSMTCQWVAVTLGLGG